MCPGALDPELHRQVFDPCPAPLSISKLADILVLRNSVHSFVLNICGAHNSRHCCGHSFWDGQVHYVGGDPFHREELHCIGEGLIKRGAEPYPSQRNSLPYSIQCDAAFGAASCFT